MIIYKDKHNNLVYEIDNTKLGEVKEPLETGIGDRHKLYDDTHSNHIDKVSDKNKQSMKKIYDNLETGIGERND